METPLSDQGARSGSANAHPLRGKRVLLAEDDDVARCAMADFLRSLGAEVIETNDGGRMLVAVAAHYKNGRSPADLDLIVTDLMMPVFGGLEIFQGLRAAGWKTPVIVVTALDTQTVRDTVAQLGAAFILKPLDLAELERAIRAQLAR